MTIDWKALAQSQGYKKLKAAVIRDVQGCMRRARTPEEIARVKAGKFDHDYWGTFRFVMGRLQHYAHHTGRPAHEILDEWEAHRDYWYMNYYRSNRIPKLNQEEPVTPAMTDRLICRWFTCRNGKYRKLRNREERINRQNQINRTRKIEADRRRKAAGKKPRWTPAQRKQRDKLVRLGLRP